MYFIGNKTTKTLTNYNNIESLFEITDTKFQISDYLLSSNVSGSTVLLDAKRGEYYELNEVATFIWEQLKAEDKTIEDLKELVLTEFDVEEKIVHSDIKKILNDLVKEKLVEII